MHVYLRDELVRLEMRQVPADGLIAPGSGLVAMEFYADENESPSFRAVLPEDTVSVLESTLAEPVRLGLLADEPDGGAEIKAMVGISITVDAELEFEEEDEEEEPWRESLGDPEAWKGESFDEEEPAIGGGRTALLAFAPLVRFERQFPDDFAEELADLLESALAGATRPSLEARVEQLLEDL